MSESISDPLLSSTVIQHLRELIAKTLADHKQKKLKRKLPVDMQMLDCAQEDLKLQKKFIERMELSDQQYTETIGKLSKNMDKLTNSIVDGFAVLKNALYCPPPIYYVFSFWRRLSSTCVCSSSWSITCR